MPLDHSSIMIPQAKINAATEFLKSSMQHMGFKEVMDFRPHAVGLGEQTAYFWFVGVDIKDEAVEAQVNEMVKKNHVAFKAENAQQVRDFHAAALKAGATCNGKPGIRSNYSPDYYAAFVKDPILGINFEVVSRNGEA